MIAAECEAIRFSVTLNEGTSNELVVVVLQDVVVEGAEEAEAESTK